MKKPAGFPHRLQPGGRDASYSSLLPGDDVGDRDHKSQDHHQEALGERAGPFEGPAHPGSAPNGDLPQSIRHRQCPGCASVSAATGSWTATGELPKAPRDVNWPLPAHPPLHRQPRGCHASAVPRSPHQCRCSAREATEPARAPASCPIDRAAVLTRHDGGTGRVAPTRRTLQVQNPIPLSRITAMAA
jgi:hypothetical protein